MNPLAPPNTQNAGNPRHCPLQNSDNSMPVALKMTGLFEQFYRPNSPFSSHSSENLQAVVTQEALSYEHKLEAASGKMWDCISCSPGRFGGEIFTLEHKSDYYNFEGNSPIISAAGIEKIREIYPATEPWAEEILVRREVLYRKHPIMRELGYDIQITRDKKLFISLPDEKELLSAWEKQRELNPKLPPLRIAPDKGILTDERFIAVNLEYDFVLSFLVHDHLYHAQHQIAMMLSFTDGESHYHTLRPQLNELIRKGANTIAVAKKVIAEQKSRNLKDRSSDIEKLILIKKHIGKIEFILSAMVDLTTSFDGERLREFLDRSPSSLIEEGFNSIWGCSGGLYEPTKQHLFPGENISLEELAYTWECMKQLTSQIIF